MVLGAPVKVGLDMAMTGDEGTAAVGRVRLYARARPQSDETGPSKRSPLRLESGHSAGVDARVQLRHFSVVHLACWAVCNWISSWRNLGA